MGLVKSPVAFEMFDLLLLQLVDLLAFDLLLLRCSSIGRLGRDKRNKKEKEKKKRRRKRKKTKTRRRRSIN